MRCNPWSPGGIDHVPDKFTLKTKKMRFDGLYSNTDDGSCEGEVPFSGVETQDDNND